MIGTIIGGRYKVLSLIGEGGMGAVFLVEHTVIRKRLALKVLNDQMMKSPEAVARFEREALAAAHIDHPNVVAATDSGRTESGALFVVLEYVDGRSLRDTLGDGPLPPPLSLHVARQVTSALVRAHGMGIIHRDLKPENIMLVARDGDDSMVKVLDFGLAKLSVRALLDGVGGASPSEVLTRYGAVFGTPAYMAPEQVAGGEVDGRTDLYGLGVVFYEMLTGNLPFDGDDSAALLRQHVVAKVPSIRERVPALKISVGLEALVMRLLEKRPDNRFESAKALLEAIDVLVAAESLRYEPGSPTVRIKGPGLRLRPPTEANQRPTVVAPDDMAAQKFAAIGTAETQVEPGLSRQSLPTASEGESLALALKDLSELAGPKGQDGPSLGGLAEQFGANATPGATAGGSSQPPLLAQTLAKEATPPKLRAPSSIDLQVLQPEAAAAAVLTPAPPPTLRERAKDAKDEAVGWWRGTGWPTTKKIAKQVATAIRTHVPVYWGRLLAFVRSRLPEKHRGISERLLGLAVGAALALPLLILILVLARSGGDSVPSGSGGMAGFASDREMERGVQSGARDLEKLAAKYPNDSRIFRSLVRAQADRKNYGAALRALTSLAKLDPTMASDDEMAKIAARAATLPETCDAAIALLESSLGDKGVSVLTDLAAEQTTEPLKSKLNASLQKGTVRALASEATIILIDLRMAQRCEDKRGLLHRAGQQGDARTLAYLQGLQKTTGCGAGEQADCWPCMRKGTALQATIDTLKKRLGVQ
jgi:serine/threonine protein kinase